MRRENYYYYDHNQHRQKTNKRQPQKQLLLLEQHQQISNLHLWQRFLIAITLMTCSMLIVFYALIYETHDVVVYGMITWTVAGILSVLVVYYRGVSHKVYRTVCLVLQLICTLPCGGFRLLLWLPKCGYDWILLFYLRKMRPCVSRQCTTNANNKLPNPSDCSILASEELLVPLSSVIVNLDENTSSSLLVSTNRQLD